MEIKSIKTERLTLTPITLEITKGLLDGDKSVLGKYGLKADEQWPTADDYDILPVICQALEKNGQPSGFETWMIARTRDGRVIGDIGFYGMPDERGEVEIGFGLAENERGKGYASEALNAMMAWLRAHAQVKAVKARCLSDNPPSARLLEKAGLKEAYRDKERIYWVFIKDEGNTHQQ